ncbi:MAG: aminopeptidase P family protein [Candidatus Micrarchaeota archaeon]|nr:aminopeptidase P family protein [Candidatus Micrarchaeota archaeon]MDE1848336.1 aminopeptidase P family protein [Candidatus Micrarchaeota archaeon]MDE1864954.1 aminopeptidase P family protein [Candidatus Micrarchaeota archaeon]
MAVSIKSRVKAIFERSKGAQVIVLVNGGTLPDPNFIYLTGYTNSAFENDILVFTRSSAYHITSPLDYGAAMLEKHPEIKIILADKAGTHRKLLSKLLKGKKVGINASFLTVNVHQAIKKRYKPKSTIDVSGAFDSTRLVKSEHEIAQIKKAVLITKWAMLAIQKEFAAGMSEKALAAKFDMISAQLGSRQPSFETIVCFGKNAALPHHVPDETKLQNGDFILIDAGAKVNNYCSDLTRTFIFGEQKGKEAIQIYETVKKAQVLSIRAIKPGVKASKIYDIANDYINKVHGGKYKGKFTHALGHSLGIEVHDSMARLLSPKANDKLVPGMVVTVEPGIYISGLGGVRIEDDIVVTEESHIIL